MDDSTKKVIEDLVEALVFTDCQHVTCGCGHPACPNCQEHIDNLLVIKAAELLLQENKVCVDS